MTTPANAPSAWPTISNDDGTGQIGTPGDETLFSAIEDCISSLVHSSNNSSVTPADAIDEVVTARGNKSSLNARIAGVIDADGALVTQASLVSNELLADSLDGYNKAINGKFTGWADGASSAPDNWTLSGTGAAVARTGVSESDTTRNVGQYAAKLTYGSDEAKLTQTLISTGDWNDFDYLEGTLVQLRVLCYSTTVDKCSVAIDDGVTVTPSDDHTGDGTWQALTVSHTVTGSSTKLDLILSVDGTGNGVFSGVVVLYSDTLPTRYIEAPAPTADILTLSADSALPNERTFTPGDGLEGTDDGAGSTYTLDRALSPGQTVIVESDLLALFTAGAAATYHDGFLWSKAGSANGTVSPLTTGIADHPGILIMQSGTTSGDFAYGAAGDLHSDDFEEYVGIFKLNGTITDMAIKVGLCRVSDLSTTATTAHGCFFLYDTAINGNWHAVCSDGTAFGTPDTSFTVAVDDWYVLRILRSGSSMLFYINGELQLTATTNIPSAAAYRVVAAMTQTLTSAHRIIHADYIGVRMKADGQRYTDP